MDKNVTKEQLTQRLLKANSTIEQEKLAHTNTSKLLDAAHKELERKAGELQAALKYIEIQKRQLEAPLLNMESNKKIVLSHFAEMEKMEGQEFMLKTDQSNQVDLNRVGKRANKASIIDYLTLDVNELLENTFAGAKFRIVVEAEQI